MNAAVDQTQNFFNRVYAAARDAGARHVQAAVAAAQAAIETGWGKAVKDNAYFGIKAGTSWDGKSSSFTTHEETTAGREKIVDSFRAYASLEESVEDYLSVIAAKWPHTHNATTIAAAADGLENGVHGRYATDRKYAAKVTATAEKRADAAADAYEGVAAAVGTDTGRHANPRSSILPLYRPAQGEAVTRAILSRFEHLTPPRRRGDKVKVLFVRGYYGDSMGKRGQNDRAIYDDAVFVVTPDGVQPFNGNSDPSAFRKRIASIEAPQAVRYRPGPHGYARKAGPYPAFRQDASCTVIRDGAGRDTGMFHVNLHRGGADGTSSAGCLTIPPHQWDEFHGLLTRLLAKHEQDTFFVTLVAYDADKPPISLPATDDTAASGEPPSIGKEAGALVVAGTGGAAGAAEAARQGVDWLTLSLWIAAAAILIITCVIAVRRGWHTAAWRWLRKKLPGGSV